jgi:hypothetical protein
MNSDAMDLWGCWIDTRAGWDVETLMRGIDAKLSSQAARLALILHCLKHAERSASVPLAVDTLRDGLVLVEYFRGHNRLVLEHLQATSQPSTLPRALRVSEERTWVFNTLRNEAYPMAPVELADLRGDGDSAAMRNLIQAMVKDSQLFAAGDCRYWITPGWSKHVATQQIAGAVV